MGGRRIREDHNRYRDIIRDKVKSRLKEHIKTGQKIERRGKDLVVVDIPVIELPDFRFGDPFKRGFGAGEGEIGDEVGHGPPLEDNDSDGEPGKNRGEHMMGVGVTVDNFIEILGEELNLPKLKPKPNSELIVPKIKYNRISKIGNNSLLHKKRTLKNVIKRAIASDEFDANNLDNLYPVPEDKEYRSWSEQDKPDVSAAVFFMADISASMSPDKRDLIKELCWYLECWIKKFYKHTDLKYLVHDVEAFEVDSEKFYGYTSGGGTKISSVFSLVNNIIDSSYPLDEWNIYCFYLSDGENWDDDNSICIKYMDELQVKCNVVGVTEVKGESHWAEFVLSVEEAIDKRILDEGTVITATVDDHKDILDALKIFLTVGSK